MVRVQPRINTNEVTSFQCFFTPFLSLIVARLGKQKRPAYVEIRFRLPHFDLERLIIRRIEREQNALTQGTVCGGR
jgi:hypothetical protein